MLQPRSRAALVPVLLIAGMSFVACGGSAPSSGPVRVYPNEAGTNGRADLSIVGASLTEDAIRPAKEQLLVAIEVTNVGAVPVSGFAVQEGHISAPSLNLPVTLSFAATADQTPIEAGQTRPLALEATLVPLGLCTSDLEASPNPHHGLATIGFTFLTSGGAHAVTGVDVAVTCQFSTNPPPDAGAPDVPTSDAGMMGGDLPDAGPDVGPFDAPVSDARMEQPDA